MPSRGCAGRVSATASAGLRRRGGSQREHRVKAAVTENAGTAAHWERRWVPALLRGSARRAAGTEPSTALARARQLHTPHCSLLRKALEIGSDA